MDGAGFYDTSNRYLKEWYGYSPQIKKMSMEITIDEKSGFCFGVKRAIKLAEAEVSKRHNLYCLGDIVHNSEEVNRLHQKGIEFITREKYFTLSDCRVLIRAHGEPPETFIYAQKNNIDIIDATCPVVLKLQEKVKRVSQNNADAQIVIFGMKDHPEVTGLKGQVSKTIIIESIDEIAKIDFTQSIYLFAQTTKGKNQYSEIIREIQRILQVRGLPKENLITADSICGQVANRAPRLAEFSHSFDTLIFVGGRFSSNSKVLFNICKENNDNSYFVTNTDDLENIDFRKSKKIGICGATSTPGWLIKKVAKEIRTLVLQA